MILILIIRKTKQILNDVHTSKGIAYFHINRRHKKKIFFTINKLLAEYMFDIDNCFQKTKKIFEIACSNSNNEPKESKKWIFHLKNYYAYKAIINYLSENNILIYHKSFEDSIIITKPFNLKEFKQNIDIYSDHYILEQDGCLKLFYNDSI